MKTKKMLAAILSAAMVMSMSMTAFAAAEESTDSSTSDPNTGTVTAPIFSYDVTQVIVPTKFQVAFNPDEWDIKTGNTDADKSNAQIVSKSYGIINKSTKSKIVSVALNVEDLNGDEIVFVDSADAVTEDDDSYKLFLEATPSNKDDGVKIGSVAVDKEAGAQALADVVITPASGKGVALHAGDNEITFMLDAAKYQIADGQSIGFDTTVEDLEDILEVKELGTNGATGFTFTGKMNKKASWNKLTGGLKITAVYTNETAEGTEEIVEGTGAMYNNPAPKFSTGSGVGTISYKKGTGDEALKSITKIEMDNGKGKLYDGYNALPKNWSAATDVDGLITFASEFTTYYASLYPDDTTVEATITYVTENDEAKTVKVGVKVR